ncbi:hypothetical protein [Acidaminococcus fermentans]|jgi:hypothetical protein|uniref:hypothetical protein n=1 Tax=Acidaminococcus fermentans TaxID=905 RepID=UPI003F8C7918
MITFTDALKAAQLSAKIKMRSFCVFDKYFVFRGARPEQKLYGAVYTTVDRKTGETGLILGSALPRTKWIPIFENLT